VKRVTDTDFPPLADEGPEDLPRTLRREREARQRAMREEEARRRGDSLTPDFRDHAPQPAVAHTSYAGDPAGATVTRINVPFFRLVGFFIKAVFAAIPALILLGVLLWFAGQALKTLYPQLVHTEVIIRVPQ
jgi:hypothetical protein